MTYEDFLAERLIDTLESISAKGLRPEFIDDTDAMLQTYWGKGIDWRFVYLHNMASRSGRDLEPKNRVPYGHAPYWALGPDEGGVGVKPLSVLAFMPTSSRRTFATEDATGTRALTMLKSDPDDLTCRAALANLVRHGRIFW